MKREIKHTIDPTTGQKSITMKFDIAGLNDLISNIHVERHSYYDWWNEQKWLHKYWAGYEKFLQADSPNRPGIMTEAATVMVSWFKQGVLYDSSASLLGPGYYGEPEALPKLLKIAQGKILANVLENNHIPEYIRPQILMFTSARGYGKDEIKASFEWKDYRLGDDVVYGTEDMEPEERANYVANTWYDYICHRLYGFVNELYAKESDKWKQPQSLQTVEKYLEAEQKLKDLGLDLPNRLEYYARWLGYQCTEVSEMLQTIGINKSADAVKKSYHRNKELMKVNYKNSQ